MAIYAKTNTHMHRIDKVRQWVFHGQKAGKRGKKTARDSFLHTPVIHYGFVGYAYFNVLRGVLVEEETLGNFVFQENTKFEMACLMMPRSGIKTFESPDNPLTMMPEGQHGIFSSCAKRGFVNILAGTHETHVFRDASRDLCFVGAVIDHDEQAANDEVIGHLGE
jgi:hypothetical protein